MTAEVHRSLVVPALLSFALIARGLVGEGLCETPNQSWRICFKDCAMKLSKKACENNHKVTGMDSHSRMSSFTLPPATLAVPRTARRYQTVFRGEFTDSKRVKTVRNGPNRLESLDSHTAKLTGHKMLHR